MLHVPQLKLDVNLGGSVAIALWSRHLVGLEFVVLLLAHHSYTCSQCLPYAGPFFAEGAPRLSQRAFSHTVFLTRFLHTVIMSAPSISMC